MKRAIIYFASFAEMCGIAGQLRLDGGPVDRDLVARMTARLAHRGPDAEGYYFNGPIGLGHRRLSIIDLARGQQPMLDRERGFALVANNEIYNYRELTRELSARGCAFRTNSDTEVILRLFATTGLASVRRLEGMFAFAIWDETKNTLVLVRDRFGVKPLYYYQDESTFLFASEMASLFEYPELNKELNPAAIDGYLASLAIPEPQSALAHVHKLPAGHYMTIRQGRQRSVAYWEPPLGERTRRRQRVQSAADLEAGLNRHLDRSVAMTLRSDVPVGILLSGGLDSSTVAAVAARVNGHRYPTFSATFQESDFDERSFARLAAKRFGGTHREVLVTKARATRIAQSLATTLDEPFADASAIPTYAVCELASAHVKTVLSGEGADELFAGYPWHLTRAGRAAARQKGHDHPARAVFRPSDRRVLYSPSWNDNLDLWRTSNRRAAASPARARMSPLNRSLLDDLERYLPSDILFKSDRMSMRHSLELRVPFLNHRLAEYVMRLPETMKVKGEVRKLILRRVMNGILPAEILQRPKKGFSIPLDLWLWQRGAWRDMVYDTIFSATVRQRGQWNMVELERLQREHERLEHFHGYRLWTIFMFEMWRRSFLEQPTGRRRS